MVVSSSHNHRQEEAENTAIDVASAARRQLIFWVLLFDCDTAIDLLFVLKTSSLITKPILRDVRNQKS